MNFLDDIIKLKIKNIEDLKEQYPIKKLKQLALSQPEPKKFIDIILASQKPRIIAEIKKASPSKGIIYENFDALSLAIDFENKGACALSVLTEIHYFEGSPYYISQIKEEVNIPILRKDFILDEIQLYESRFIGADAVLLIAQILSKESFIELFNTATELGLDILAEVHNEEDLDKISSLPIKLIGINNRDLKTFNVDLNTTIKLSKLIPKDKYIVTESGISTKEDIDALNNIVDVFLIGEGLAKNPGLLEIRD